MCRENKGADQLCDYGGYCAAVLRLCFRICKWLFFFHHVTHLIQMLPPIGLGKQSSADPDQTAPRGAVLSRYACTTASFG